MNYIQFIPGCLQRCHRFLRVARCYPNMNQVVFHRRATQRKRLNPFLQNPVIKIFQYPAHRYGCGIIQPQCFADSLSGCTQLKRFQGFFIHNNGVFADAFGHFFKILPSHQLQPHYRNIVFVHRRAVDPILPIGFPATLAFQRYPLQVVGGNEYGGARHARHVWIFGQFIDHNVRFVALHFYREQVGFIKTVIGHRHILHLRPQRNHYNHKDQRHRKLPNQHRCAPIDPRTTGRLPGRIAAQGRQCIDSGEAARWQPPR